MDFLVREQLKMLSTTAEEDIISRDASLAEGRVLCSVAEKQ